MHLAGALMHVRLKPPKLALIGTIRAVKASPRHLRGGGTRQSAPAGMHALDPGAVLKKDLPPDAVLAAMPCAATS